MFSLVTKVLQVRIISMKTEQTEQTSYRWKRQKKLVNWPLGEDFLLNLNLKLWYTKQLLQTSECCFNTFKSYLIFKY